MSLPLQQRLNELGTQHVLHQMQRALQQSPVVIEERLDAAVLVALTVEESPAVILTQRSSLLAAHAGEVAFPGGKCDALDESIQATALRESFEEIGLPGSEVLVMGSTGMFVSRAGLKVQPVIGFIPPEVAMLPNPDEIASIFRVPLSLFLDEPPRHDYQVAFMGQSYVMPCYRYQGYVIWGLTAYMLVDLLNRTLQADIDFPMPRLRR